VFAPGVESEEDAEFYLLHIGDTVDIGVVVIDYASPLDR
jgi:hypothetical protein